MEARLLQARPAVPALLAHHHDRMHAHAHARMYTHTHAYMHIHRGHPQPILRDPAAPPTWTYHPAQNTQSQHLCFFPIFLPFASFRIALSFFSTTCPCTRGSSRLPSSVLVTVAESPCGPRERGDRRAGRCPAGCDPCRKHTSICQRGPPCIDCQFANVLVGGCCKDSFPWRNSKA